MFANGPDITIAGNGVPRGFARPVEGGYMIRGNWAYGSGIQHAEWVHSGCFLTDAEGKDMIMGPTGQPKIIVTHHPRSTIKLMGNWDVLGLRATGSFDYTLSEGDELFVPTHMTYDFDIDAPRRGGTQGALGLAGYSAWAHSGWAVGVGRRILDELVKVIVQRRDPFGKSSDSEAICRAKSSRDSIPDPARCPDWQPKSGRGSRRRDARTTTSSPCEIPLALPPRERSRCIPVNPRGHAAPMRRVGVRIRRARGPIR